MKKLFFMLAFLAISKANHAQTQIGKGRQMIGGFINFAQNSTNYSDTTGNRPVQGLNSSSYGVGIHYGYFITNHIMIGANGSLNQNLNKSNQDYHNGADYHSTQTNQTYNGGIFLRYYNMLGKSKFALYCQLGLNYGAGNGSTKNIYTYTFAPTETFESKSKTSYYGASLNPGITYFINNKFAIETSLGSIAYNAQNTKNYQDGNKISETNDSHFNSALLFSFSSISLGLNFYFGGKKPEPEVAK